MVSDQCLGSGSVGFRIYFSFLDPDQRGKISTVIYQKRLLIRINMKWVLSTETDTYLAELGRFLSSTFNYKTSNFNFKATNISSKKLQA